MKVQHVGLFYGQNPTEGMGSGFVSFSVQFAHSTARNIYSVASHSNASMFVSIVMVTWRGDYNRKAELVQLLR